MARQSTINRLANVGLILLAFSDAIQALLAGRWGQIIYDYTGGLAGNPQTGIAPSTTGFDTVSAGRAYGPIAAAFVLYEVKKELVRKLPVRG